MAFPLKKIISPILLLSFLAMAFFSFAIMSYGPDGRMRGDCPLATTGASLCPQDAAAMTLHHLSAYQAFLNVPVNFGLAMLAALFFAIGLARILFQNLFSPAFVMVRALYESPPSGIHSRRLLRWLSILENSPSFP